jgi:iron complex transport system substrate-binding protein
VPADPRRVVTVGLIDHDAALAVGVAPVGVTANEFSADQPYGVWRWAQDELGEAEPVVLPEEPMNAEAIAALRPDLILAVYSGLTEEQYDALSQIAPTVAQSGDHEDYETPWHEMTRTIGRALGREDRAEEAIQQVEDMFARARDEHPEFDGESAVYAGFIEAGQYYAEAEGSTRSAVLTELGFTIPDLPADGFYAEVSREQVETLDRDVLLWELGDASMRDSIESDALYERLDVAREGRDVFVTDPDLAGGLALISVLSLPYVVERLVPMLSAAVDGDPATPIPG